MAKYDLNRSPYFDDYKSDKQYTHLLAVPGRVAQAREITQIQSVVKDIIKSVGDSLMKDGDVIEGCQVSVENYIVDGVLDTSKKKVSVSEGKIYINGMVLPVPATLDILIPSSGEVTVGFILKEVVIDEYQDPSLADPAIGYDNYQQPGCHRLKSYLEVTIDNPEVILVNIIDGAIKIERNAPEFEKITQTLARRTYDESGSYLVDGLKVRVEGVQSLEDDTEDYSEYFDVIVESGKAYVLGYELKIPAARRVRVKRSLETRDSLEHAIDSFDTSKRSYYLGEDISEITRVEGYILNSEENLVLKSTELSGISGRVYAASLTPPSADAISSEGIEFYEGSTKIDTVYLHRVQNQYYIVWNDTSTTPTGNYKVTYRHLHRYSSGIDYRVSDDNTNIEWLVEDQRLPVNGTRVEIDYKFYLARKDIVCIDAEGNIFVVEGTPEQDRFESIPEAKIDTLSLAIINNPPAGTAEKTSNNKITVSNIGLTRFTMNDIQKLIDRVRNIEYDQAVLALQDDARNRPEGLDMKGIYADPFIDLSKIDFTYDITPDSDEQTLYDVTVDLLNNLCYLPTISNTYDLATIDQSNIKGKATIYPSGRTATLKKTDRKVVLSQPSATKAFHINPYTKFPKTAEINITPAVDSWIDDSIIEVPVSKDASEVVSTSTRNLEYYNYRGSRRADTVVTSYSDTAIGTRVSTSSTESVIATQASKYIRSRTIQVNGSNFSSGLKDIYCYFDGVRVKLDNGKYTVDADEYGRFTTSFKIPAQKFLTGIREVRFEASDNEAEGLDKSAFALYQATGIDRTIQRTVTTVTTVLLNRVTTISTTHNVDPVGQTFILDRMTYVDSVGLYFSEKDESVEVTCEIREVLDGNITSTVFGHSVLSPDEVYVDNNTASTETKFIFDDPVLLEGNKEYAIVVRSTSTAYKVWVSELGGTDITDGKNKTVLSNPYLVGVMMSSSNNSSWTTHQTTDLKFKIYEAVYEQESELLFDPLEGNAEEFSRLYLFAETLIPQGTDIKWYYSLDQGKTFKNISLDNIVTGIKDCKIGDVQIKAILSRNSNSALTPVVALDSVGASFSKYDTGDYYYVSKLIRGLDDFSDVNVILDQHIPDISHNSIEVFVEKTIEGKTTRMPATRVSEGTFIDLDWEEVTYHIEGGFTNSDDPYDTADCRLLIKLHSDTYVSTPAFRRLRMIFL